MTDAHPTVRDDPTLPGLELPRAPGNHRASGAAAASWSRRCASVPAALLAAAALGGLASCASAPPAEPDGPPFLPPTPLADPDPARDAEWVSELGPMAGEFGLWVRFEGDSLRVGWITRERAPGWFEARAGGEVVHRAETPAGVAHRVLFPQPTEADEVVLRYGSEEDESDRHETRIRLDTGAERQPAVVRGAEWLYVIADIHGEYFSMRRVLENAGLIDEDGRWTGGARHLAVAGDMMSRGSDVTAVLWFLYRLEREAAEAGGAVHVLLGNHEFMVMMEDHRYVQPKELRIAEAHGVPYERMFDPHHSLLGRWLISKPVAMRIDEVLLAHGGISEHYLDYTVESLDDSVAVWVNEESFHRWADSAYWEQDDLVVPVDQAGWYRRLDFFFEETSPFWYRGFFRLDPLGAEPARAVDDPEPVIAELDRVLDRFGASVHVVGHTPVETIHELYGGRLIPVNTIPFAAEVLLLVRQGPGEYTRYRIGWEGEPEEL